MSALDNIAILLIEPQGPRNVGSVARAMKNFGLRDLRIVGAIDIARDECRQMAAGAHDVLEGAGRFETLDEATADRQLLVGTTARQRHRTTTETAAAAGPSLRAEAGRHRVGILFGREDRGLHADELALCHRVITVPVSSERASLNLAQAVLLVAYEIWQCAPVDPADVASEDGDVVDAELRRRLWEDLVDCCRAVGHLHEGNRPAVEAAFERILTLGPMQTRDARHLFGLVRATRRILEETGQSPPPRGRRVH